MAVFKFGAKGARRKADQYMQDGRVHCIAPANYTDGSKLDHIIKAYIDEVAARAALSRAFEKKQ